MRRRQLIHLTAGALWLPGCDSRPEFRSLCDDLGTDDPLDHVLAALHATDPEFEGGFSNHGPMVAEVLQHTGRSDRICEWSGGYIGYLLALPVAEPIAAEDQPGAIGDAAQRAAWIATYEAQVSGDLQALMTASWQAVLPSWASAHGPLRTGHALRSLAALDSPARRRELAHGLGYWTARQALLPGSPGSAPTSGLSVVDALERLTVLSPEEQESGGLISARLAKLDGFQPFIDEVAQVDLDVWSVERTLSELAAAAARLYVADDDRDDLGYLHAVTVTSIMRMMLPWMDEPTQRSALGYLYQAVAAFHATHASAPGVPPLSSMPETDVAVLAKLGSDDEDEHTIKLVEALLREHAIDPRPELLVAAELRLA